MSLSLQDQLLKAGLTDKNKAKQVKKEKHKKIKHQQKHKVVEVDQAKVAAEQARIQKLQKDRELNAQAKQIAEQKAIAAQIKQLIELNKQPRSKGDIRCNFTDDNLIKHIYVDQTMQNRISQGKLAIVKFADGYEVVPMPVADKIAQRDQSIVVYRVDEAGQVESESNSEEDDWYADYQIPDDLTW